MQRQQQQQQLQQQQHQVVQQQQQQQQTFVQQQQQVSQQSVRRVEQHVTSQVTSQQHQQVQEMVIQGSPQTTFGGRPGNISPPVFEQIFRNARFAQGGNALFEGKVRGQPKPVVSWTRKGAPLLESVKYKMSYDEQSGKVSLLINTIGPGDEGEYTCTAQNQYGEAICSVYIQPEGHLQPQIGGYQKEFAQTFESTEQTQSTFQRYQKQTSDKVSAYSNGHIVEEDFKVDTFEYRLLREVEFRESITRRFIGEVDSEISTVVERSLGSVAPPQIAQKPRNSKLTEGAEATFQAKVTANPKPRLTWFKNGQRITSSQKHQTSYSNQQVTLKVQSVNSSDSGHYTLLAENPQGCVVSSAYLAVEPSSSQDEFFESRETSKSTRVEGTVETDSGKTLAPNFVRVCTDREVTEGKMTRFDCRVTGRPYPEVAWFINGRQVSDDASHKVLVNESGNHALMITNVHRSDAGIVGCIARNKSGETSFQCNLLVIEKEQVVAPKFVERFTTVNVKEGEPVVLNARAVGTPIPRITWQKDGVPITPGQNVNITTDSGASTLDIPRAKASDAAWYQCTAQNVAGSTATRARLFVETPKSSAPQPRRLNLPRPTKVIEPEPQPGPEVIYLRHVERAKPHAALPEEDRIYPPPQFIIPLSNVQQVEGGRVHLEARIEPVGDPTMRVEWFINGRPLEASSRATTTFRFGFIALDLISIIMEDSGEYICRVTSSSGSVESQALLSVTARASIEQSSQYPDSLQYIQQLEDYSRYQRQESLEETIYQRPNFIRPLQNLGELQEGRNAHFEAQLTPVSDPTMKVEWYKDGRTITASSRITTLFNFGYVSLNIMHLRVEDAGTYTVRAVNRLGEAVSSSTLKILARTSVTGDLGIPEQQRYIEKVEELEAYQQQQQYKYVQEVPESTSPPEFKSPIKDQLNIREGGFAHFEARLEPIGDSTLRVEWLKDGRPVEASSRITTFFNFGYVALTIKYVTIHDIGTYTCRAYNNLGQSTTSANLTVVSKKDIILDSQHPEGLEKIQYLEDSSRYGRNIHEETVVSQKPRFLGPLKGTNKIVEGQRAHFEVRVEPQNDMNMTLEWYFNGKVIMSANRIQTYYDFGYIALDIESVRSEDAGTYTVVARNALGEAQISATMEVETRSSVDTSSMHHGTYEKTQRLESSKFVEPQYHIEEISKSKPIFVQPLQDPKPISEGKNIHLECRLEPMGDPTMRVEWFYNGRAITVGSRFRTYYDFGYVALDIVHATSLDSGEYTVRATNHLGSAHSSACVRVISRSDILTESQNEAALEQIQMLEDSSRYRRTMQDDLTVIQTPQFTRPLHNIETVEGTNIHLECRLQPVGDPAMRVDWFVNGRPVKTGHRFRPAYDFDYVALDLLSVYAVDSGVYTCQARNQLGEAVTSCSVRIIAKKDLILESQHPSGLEKIQYLEDASRYKRTEYIDEVVNVKPRFVTKPKSLDNMREGQHAHFECKLEPVTDTNLKVEWYKNGRPITVGHRFRPIHDFGYVALDIIDLIAEDSGSYTCRAVNLVGADETTCTLNCRSTAQIVTGTQNEVGLEQIQYLEDRSRHQRTEYTEETTKQAPVFTTSLKHIEIKEGQRAHFECRLIPVSDPTMKVEWFHNNVPVKSGSRFTETNNFGFVALDIMYCYPEDSGVYTCRARNAVGEAVTSANLVSHSKKSIYLESQHEEVLSRLNYLEDSSRYQRQAIQEETVTQAPVFTQPMRDVKCAENQAAHFEARLIPVGDSKLRVEWLRNGVPIQASNRVTTMHDFGYVALNMKYVYPEDSGTYTCRAINDLGQAVTSATLVVHSKASLLLESQHEGALQKLQMLEDTSRYQRREEEEIIVTQPPKFTAQLNGPTNLMEGQSAHYECRIEPYPDPNLKVEWFHNGKPLQTGHRFRTTYDFGFAALDILTVYGEDSGEYTCKATNKLGQATSSVKVNVKSRSSIILDTQHEGALQKIQYLEDDSRHRRTAAEDAVIMEKPQFGRPLRNVENLPEGQSAHLEATLTPVNDPTMKVEWFCNGRPIAQGHRFKTTYDFGFVALDILYAYAEDSGTYMCKARNAVGEAVTTCSVKVIAKSGLYLDTLDEQRLKKIRDLEAYERPQKVDAEPQAQRPVFITPLNNLEHLKEGEHAHLECRVEPINDANLKIEWFVNGVAIKTGHRFRTTHDFGYVALDVLYTYPEDSGTYMCKATNLMGEAVNTCTINVAARRSIYLESQHPEGLQKIQELEAQGRPGRLEVEEPIPTPPRFITELRGTTELVEGQTAHFEAQVEPLHDPNLRIELYHNGKPLPSASRFHITFDFGYLALDIGHIVPEDAGEYTAKAINALGQCTSSISVRVQGKSNIIMESQRPEGMEKIRQLEEHTPFQRPEIPEPTRQRPVFTQPLQNIDAVAEGQTAHFECRLIPVGDPTLKVEWFRNEKPLETSSRITKTHDFGYVALDMTHVRGEDDGVYMCRASNALGEAVTTASMKIRTKANIQLETQHPEGMKKIQQLEQGRVPSRRDEPDQAFEKPIFTQVLTGPSELWEGQNAHFECRVVPVGDPSLRFEWYINGVELKMGSRFHVTHDFGFVTLDINKVITEDSGVYMCKAINKAGEAVSSTSLKVKSKSSIMGEPMQPDAWQKIQLKEAEMNKVPEMFVDTTPQQAPVFTTHLVNHDKLVEGQHVLLEAQVEPRADPNLRTEWFKNGITLTTGTRIRSTFDFGLVTLNINGLRADDSAIYTCKATNLLGEAVSTCTLKVEDRHWLLGSSLRPEALPQIEALEQPRVSQVDAPEPVYESPVFISHLNNNECQEGESVHFECHVEPSKDPTLNIEWFVNGKPLPSGARFKSTYDFGYVALDINHAYSEDSGVYMCKATNSKGQASTSGTLKCISKQNIYLDTQHPQGQAGLEKVEEVDEAYAARMQRQESRPDAQYPKPVFIVPLQPEFSLGENEALHLECQVEPKEDPNLKVEWYFNGKALEHGSRFKMTCDFGFVTLDLTDVYERDQGIYTCKAHNRQGEAFTSTTVYCKSKESLIEHTQHPKGTQGLEKIQDLEESLRRQEGAAPDGEEGHPPVFTSQFQNLKNLSEGEIAHFEASLTPVGDQTMTVEWFYNGEVLKASHRTRTVHAFGMVVLEILGTKIEDSGTYTCRATNKWGRAEISVELECVEKSKGQKPQFTTQIQNLDGLKDGESAHFECTLIPVGDPHLKVEWFHNGQPLRHSSRIKTVSDFGFVVLDIAYVQSHDSGEYVCRASNKYGEDFTRATIKCQGKGGVYFDTLQPDSLARIKELETFQGGQATTPTSPVLEPPVFTTHISDITQLVEGQSAHFEARLTPVNDPNLTVEWFYNGKKLPHGHRYRTFHDFGIVILDILYCYEENSGVYECRAVNKIGQDVTKATLKCVSKANLILDSQLPRGMEGGLEKIQTLEDSLVRTRDERVSETKGQAPVFTVPLSNIDSLREGENAHFEARLTPTDDPKLKVEWFWNGKPLKTGSRFRTFCDFGFVILEISPVYPEDSGEYSCRAFNDYGEAVTTASMKVQGKRSIILESQLPKGMEHTIEKIAELEGLGITSGQQSADEDVGKPPEFITTPADLTLGENSLAHFECRLSPVNDPSMRVEWYHNGKALSAGSRIKTINDFGFVILEVAGVYQRDSGLYTCKATNRHGEATVSCKLQVRGRQGIILEPQLPSNFRTGTESIQKLEESLYKRDEILAEEEKPNPPKFIVELKDIADVPEGSPIHFECRVEPVGDSSMRIDWFHNGRPFATGSRVHMLNDFGFIVLDMDYTYARDSGEYICRATNKWGSATTKATLTCKAKHDIVLESQLPQGMSGAKLKELERGPLSKALPEDAPLSPPKFITQITSVGIGEGERVHFECRVEPKTDPKLRVEWYRNGKLLPTGHRFRTIYDMGFVSLDILYTYPEDSGEYVCRAVNDLGEDKTRATISCKKLPTIILQNQVPKGMKKSEALMQMEATIKKYTSEIHLTEDDLYDIEKKQPPRFVTQIKDQTTLVEMQSTKFECQLAPVGDPNMKVEWFLNGKPLPHKNRFTPIYDFGYVAMNFGWVYPEDSGEYLCRATNLYGMDETRAVIKTAGKPGIIYESQLPKGMKSIERIREMEAAWQIVPEEPDEGEKPKTAPVFVTKPEPYIAMEGEPARFCCRVTGFPRPRVMWVVNGHTVVNGTRYKLTYDGMWHLDIPKTRQYDNGKVEVIARSSAGEAVAVSDLTVKQRQDDYRNVLKNSPRQILGTKEYRKPEWVTHMEELQAALRATQCVPTFVQEIKDSRAKESESITFECQFSGTPMPDVTWYKNDKSLRNTKNIQIRIKDNKTSCTILKATPEDEGIYTCKAISDIGSVTTRAQLYIQALSLDERKQIELKKAQEEEEKIRLERVKLEKVDKKRKKKGLIIIESEGKRETADVQETQILETTTTFTDTAEQVTAKKIVPIQDSVEISAVASCKKVDETTEPILVQEEKAEPIVSTQESVEVSEVQIEGTLKDLKQKRTKKVAERKAPLQESIAISEVTTEETVKEFVQERSQEQAKRKLIVQQSVNVSEIITDTTVQDISTEEIVEDQAQRISTIQKPLVISEVQSGATVKEFEHTQEFAKAQKKVSVQESIAVAEVQSEAAVEELLEKKPKSHHVKTEITEEDQVDQVVQKVEQQILLKKEVTHKKEERKEVIRAEEILEKEQTKIATEIEELMNFIQAKEFGPGESPLRDLACIGYLVRHGVTVNEITTLYQTDHFPALQTPVAQSALVQLVEREGHGALISQVLTEESTTDEAVVGETVGFRAFMRMVELKHAAVEEVITHFAPEDFSPDAWEAQEAMEIVDKRSVQETVQVTQETEVLLQEKRKQKKKIKQRQEVDTEEAVSLSITRETEVFEEGVEEVIVTEYEEGDKFYSLCSYMADNEDALNLVEGERVYILETHNSDWWFVRKHLTEQKGWVPAQLLMDEPSYTLYVQKKLHEKIDKLPVFEKPASEEKVSAPRFVEKLQPKHAPDGVTVQFECQVEGNPRPQIAWFKQTAIILPSQDFQIYYDDDNVATLIVKEAFPEDAGTYTCVAKNAAGFASSSTELIVEGPLSDHGSESTLISRKSLSRESSLADILEGIPPIFSRKPQPLCVKEGTDVEIECRLVAVPEPDVVWNFRNTKVQTRENITVINESDMHMYTSIIRIKNVKKSQEGVYEVVAQNREGESKVSITLKVKTEEKEPPQILEPLKCTTVDEGDGVILSAQIIGNPTPKVSWLKDGKPVSTPNIKSDGVTHTITLPKTSPEDAGLYSVQAKNNVGSAETTASLNVRECPGEKMEPPLFIERFQEVKVPEKGKLQLIAKVTGKPIPEITWLRNNIPLKPSPHIKESFDGENITLEITDVNSEVDAGDYKCIASNPVGKASHGSKISVDVEKVSFTRLLENVVNVDERDTLSLECETSHTVSTKWFHNGKELSGMDHRMVIQEGRIHRLVIKEIKLRDAGTYKCTVKNQATESTVSVLEGKPDFTRKLQDFEVKERELAVLEVEVSSETADVTWHKDGEQISEQHEKFIFEKQGGSRRLLIRGTSVHDEGEYTCVLGEQECTADVTVVELPPEIITKMQDVTIAKGEKATFEIELTKGDALVRWFKDGKELQFSEHVQLSIDGKRQKLKVYNSELEDSGEYSCQVGEQTSSACLTVEEPVVEFITRLPDVTLIPLNMDATFTVELSRPDVEVKWLKKRKEIEPSDRYCILSEGSVRKLVIKKVTLDDQTEYTCMAVNVKTSSKLKVEIIETVPKINVETLQQIYKVKKGEDVNISVNYSATPTPKEEWFVNGRIVKKSKRVISTLTENSATLTIKQVEESDVGNYTIKLVNNCGEASAEVTLVLMEVPSVPGIPEVVEVTNDSITLHWKAPESDGNSPIINYILEFHDKSDFTWVKVNENYNIVETTYKITELVHNKEYMFRVTAVNEVGPSQPSHNTQYIKITAPVQAEAPVIQEPLKSVITGLLQPITLSCVIGGIPAPQIKWLKDGKVFKSKNVTYENRISKYTISESTETSAGLYCCQATNDAGFAETSCEVKIQESPKIEYDETHTSQKLRVTNQWKIEVKFTGYPKPEAQWTKNGKSLASTKHCTIHIDEFSSTIAIYSLNKTDSGTYTFTVHNEAGTRSVDFTVRVIDKPSKPEGPMVVKDIRRESVIIEWKPPVDDGGLELSKYSVEKCDVEKMVWMKVADVEKDVSSYCVQQLKEDAEYMFRVIAENPVGSSEALESDTITIRSKFDKPSPPRGPLDISGMTETAFIVAWQQPESDGGAPVLEYTVERREVGKKAWQRVGSTTGEVTHIEVTGLKHNVSYHFRITARNDIGLSAPFAPEEPVTAGKRISAPSAPTHFIVADISSKSVTLQWSPPVSTGGTELTGYIVEKRLASVKNWTKVVTLEPSVTQYCIENLKEKSEWFFRVYAENSIGLSPPASTDIVSLKTHASPPSPPTAPLEIRSIGANSIIIEWGIPETDGGAPIEGYTIAIRDIKKTMWMEVGRVKADVQKLAIRDLQENHEYLIRIFARNEVGLSEPLESDEPFKVLRPTDAEQLEVDKLETTAPTLSFSTETTTSWMREAGMDADIHSYARSSLLRRDEYFFRIWYYARQLFK